MVSYFRKPNFIFFGTPDFAAIILRKLCAGGLIPLAVVTNPDRPFGRKKVITPPPAKRVAREYGIPVLQPETITSDFFKELRGITADLFIVVAYAKILPADLIGLPPRGVLGVHPSLLPKLRGATPIQTAILNGDENAGTTIFLLDEKVDHGHIIASAKCQISKNYTYEILMRKLAELSGELLVETLPKFAENEITPKQQDESLATYTKKFTSEDVFIEPADLKSAQNGGPEAVIIERKIRALNPEPGVWTRDEQEKRLKLLEAEISDGKLKLKKIQLEGKLPQTLI
ncbi:MAG: Methionyl-tRNA formyltransferase [Parcubacteria group bacterium GW2011_GWA1_50_14]|nr:MAG: Methionyl-tRNA formyltransferase [Parcubacteria group bacterium GW2011_GWA1_50_14]